MNKVMQINIMTILVALFSMNAMAQQIPKAITLSNNISEFLIKPSVTDSQIRSADVPHLVWYKRGAPQGKLLLFLPGTNGIAERGPKKLFETAVEQGYRVINLSYINKQAVAQICKGENLARDAQCTEKFRTQRVFGTSLMSLIPDKPQDAIVNRFEKLLTYLERVDKTGNWGVYLSNGRPKWSIITVAGQSQGGGMAAFIAKRKAVNKIITFSGGWDFSAPEKIAKWYANDHITPLARWYGVYHSQEPRAATIEQTYKAMTIPKNHIYSLTKQVREGRRAHGEGIRNVAYTNMWETFFADGKLGVGDK